MIADVVAIIGTMDIVFGEVDRERNGNDNKQKHMTITKTSRTT